MMVDQAIATAVLVCIALMAGRAPDLLVVGIVLLAGLTWPLSFGGFTSLIPVLVPDELLPPANAIEATSLNAALIVGPLLAGAIAAVAGPEASVLTEAALTFAALLLLVGFDKLDSGPVRTGGSLLGVARDGLRALVRAPPLLATTVAGSINLMGAGLLTVAFPLFCVDELGANRNASGVLWAAFAVGSTVGALAFVGVARRHAPERVLLVSLVVFGLLMLSWPLASSLPVAIVLVAVAAVAEGPGLSATFAVRQNWAPRDLQGQIFTTAAGVKVGAFALGAAVAGPLVTSVGSADTLLISAATNFVAAAAGVWVIRRGRGRDPGRAQAGPPR
jgi:predicted MFS family arabinose efflux permease